MHGSQGPRGARRIPLPDVPGTPRPASIPNLSAEPLEAQPAARLSRRQRARRAAIAAGAVLLALCVTVSGSPLVRDWTSGLLGAIRGARAAPVPVTAGTDRFYVVVGVPWAAVTLDGRSLASLPSMPPDPPLIVSRGRHTIAWRAVPFLPQVCGLSVPVAVGDTCDLTDAGVIYGALRAPAYIILLGESLATLSVDARVRLVDALQTALSSLSDVVQPGESYYTESGAFAPVSQPLRATLTFTLDLDTGPGSVQTCSLLSGGSAVLACPTRDQNCTQLCTLSRPSPSMPVVSSGRTWYVVVFTHLSWTYTGLDGRTLLRGQPIDPGGAAVDEFPMVLRLAWSGADWSVDPLFGPALKAPLDVGGAQTDADPACAAARDLFFGALPRLDAITATRFVSGPNPAVGCLLVVTLAARGAALPSAPTAELLYRFGGLLAVDATAGRLLAHLPRADDYERTLARQLATYPGQTFTDPPRF